MTTIKIYTVEEVAEMLSINKQTVLRFIREGKIKAKKMKISIMMNFFRN